MAWYSDAVFYHIYPLGLTGAPKQNDYGEPVHRLRQLFPWIAHIRKIGCTGLYIGPLFESVGHGYETTDYKKLDSRLGTNEDLKEFAAECHNNGIRVIFDGVFNHTGRDFFAFADLKQNRENSRYRDWYCNVNFYGNNEYNDGFSYDNWGGYNLLAKLNQRNPEVQQYFCDIVRYWVSEFDADGIRLDAADVLDFDFMHRLREEADRTKKDFWLMGEVIHGDYTRWVNDNELHSVTNYQLHKALYSGHNDHNYFEIAHTVRNLCARDNGNTLGRLYNFVDNHDVERIYTKLVNKAHFVPVHILLFTLPGIPSLYYGSEFGIEGKKEKYSDASLRPELKLDELEKNETYMHRRKLISALARIRTGSEALRSGEYRELILTNRQYAFSRGNGDGAVLTVVNNDDSEAVMELPVSGNTIYVGMLGGGRYIPDGGLIRLTVGANSGEILVPESESGKISVPESESRKISSPEPESGQIYVRESETGTVCDAENIQAALNTCEKDDDPALEEAVGDRTVCSREKPAETEIGRGTYSARNTDEKPNEKPYEEMSVEELQEAVLSKLAKNGPVTDRMHREVRENIYRNSLLNWVRSFR
ncbi:MAG: alpha-amylase family glycosyl hydrolase [Clostridiales bacterium]|nr:alpha-amylase family glycosyl hydrolase [Clostridiales bacterium]